MAFINNMIKQYRIRRNEEFSDIIAKKKSKAGDAFVLYTDDRKEAYSRVGISVSKKLGNAVTRNKIKRQIRMMFANVYDFEESSKDLIVIARNRYLERSFEENQRELEKLIKSSII